MTQPQLCVTVSYGRVRGRAKQYPYFQPVVYRSKTLKDGRDVWVVHNDGFHARRSSKLAYKDALEVAASLGVPYEPNVRQYTEVTR